MRVWSDWKRRLKRASSRLSPFWIAVAVVFLAFGLCAFREIANWWQYGHNGYNGATYTQAAVNSVRFGVWGQVKYYFGLEAPPTDQYFVHHPLMLHVHLVPLVAAFGREAWVGRLVPAIYSILNMGLLFVFVRRYWGRVEALASSVIYVLLPIHLIYANMVDHEQGAIFWCLASLFVYIRWRETLQSRYFWGTMAAITMAVQWEWVGYYLALIIVLHAFACGVRRERPLRWQPEYTFAVVFSVIVLGNAAAFFGYAYAVKGTLQDLVAAFQDRTYTPDHYWSTIWGYVREHYGLLPVALFATWGVEFLFRWIRGEDELRDLLPASFFLVQLVHSAVFKEAGKIHSYWIYYFGVAVAAAGAHLVGRFRVELRRAAERFLSAWNRRRGGGEQVAPRRVATLQALLLIVAASIPLGVQAKFAWRQMNRGVAQAGVPNIADYDPKTDEVLAIREIRRRFSRRNTRFILHAPLNFRPEVRYYLDAPFERRASVAPPESPVESDLRRIFVVDLRLVEDRGALNRLVRQYRTLLFGRRFLAIELTDPGGPFEAFVRVERTPSLLWSWFVNGRVPPGRWRYDSRIQRADQLFPVPLETTDDFSAGGRGGYPFVWNCPSGTVLDGLEFLSNDGFTVAVSGVRPLCTAWPELPEATLAARRPFVGSTWGIQYGRESRLLWCDGDDVVVGIHGRAWKMVYALGIVCGERDEARPARRVTEPAATRAQRRAEHPRNDRADPPANEPPTKEAGGEDSTSSSHGAPSDPEATLRHLGPVGGVAGYRFEFVCPQGSAATVFRGQAGEALDHVGIGCGRPHSPSN